MARPRRRRLPEPRARRAAARPHRPRAARPGPGARWPPSPCSPTSTCATRSRPARVAFLDRLGGPFSSTFRPQEALSAQVLDAAVRSVNAARPDAVLVTGDLIDNAQANELALARTVLDGGRADPDSGRAAATTACRPPPTPTPPTTAPTSTRRATAGCSAAAQRPFRAPGLRAPWYAVPGNHDLLVAGELARTPSTAAVAVGARAPRHARRRARRPAQRERAHPAARRPRAQRRAARDAPRRVAPDPGRRELTPDEASRACAPPAATAAPARGWTTPSTPAAPCASIVLDTVRRDVGSGGVLAPEQTRWLARAARRGRRRGG